MAKQVRLIAVSLQPSATIGVAYNLEEVRWTTQKGVSGDISVLQNAINDGWKVVYSNSIGDIRTAAIVYTLIKEDKKEED